MSKEVYYVVIKNSFEYDDQIYSAPQQGGGKPVKVFTNRDKAEACAFRFNRANLPPMPQEDDCVLNYDVIEIQQEGD